MKDEQREALEKLEKLAAEIERNPMTAKLRADEAAEALTKRTAAADRIEVVRKQWESTIPKLQSAIEEKEAAFQAAKTALETAGAEWNAARQEKAFQDTGFDNEIKGLETILIESADSRIDEATQFFREKILWLCEPIRGTRHSVSQKRDLFSDTVTTVEETNSGAILDALNYCRLAAIPALGKMKLDPVFDLERIDAIKAGIPDINVFAEATSETALPGSRPQIIGKMPTKLESLITTANYFLTRPKPAARA